MDEEWRLGLNKMRKEHKEMVYSWGKEANSRNKNNKMVLEKRKWKNIWILNAI